MTDETPRPNRRTLLAGMALMASAAALPARAEEGAAMKHVVLLGDSIFDNKAYVGDGPDVITQLSDDAARRLDRDARRARRLDHRQTSTASSRPCRQTRPISWCRSAATTRCRRRR